MALVTGYLARTSFAAGALLLAGCATEMAIDKPLSAESVQRRGVAAGAAGMTRAQVRTLLGTPWLADDTRRVDVFRLDKTQRTAEIIFAPLPIPLPGFSHRYSGYTLVSYAPDGHVDSADSAFVMEVGELNVTQTWHKPLASARDYAFLHPFEGPEHTALAVALRRYLQDRTGPRPKGATPVPYLSKSPALRRTRGCAPGCY